MNSFGQLFRVHIFGESHGHSVGVVIDGCPAGLPLGDADFSGDLSRRKGGRKGTTPRRELDAPKIISGLFRGHTTGAPLTILFENTNVRPSDYRKIRETPRPGHADFTARKKFGGYEDYRGGGHFSGRLTLALVAAGVVAKKISAPLEYRAELIEAGGDKDVDRAVSKAVEAGDSIGGIVECRIGGVAPGLGEPFFNSVESLISHMVFSIPAIKGIEFGAGFQAAGMTGSEHNDNILSAEGRTETNHAGGINGGISNGNEICFRVVVKPTSSTGKPQRTLNLVTGRLADLVIGGRHDTCIALRVPVVVEAAAAIVMTDLMAMEQKTNRIVKK